MKIIVIGANAAGMSFAAKYHRNNPNDEIIVLEKRDYISFGTCGLPYFIGNMFNEQKTMISRTPDQINADGIDLRINSTVINVAFDFKTVTYECGDEIEELSYDKLIIACGASPIVPNFGDYKKDKVHTLTSLEDGIIVKELINQTNNQNITIIGGGFIGLEVLDMAHHLNKNVTLIEMNEQIMQNQFSSDLIEVAQKAITDANINLMLSTKVESIVDYQSGYKVITDQGEVESDLIIMAIGFKPNTSFLDIDMLPNGAIITDKHGKTSIDDVYAIGDCATVHHIVKDTPVYMPLATVANKLGRSLADYMSGIDNSYQGMLGSSCLKILDYELACTGISERDAINTSMNVSVKLVTDMNHTDYYPNQAPIVAKIIYDKETKVILGCEMIGISGVVGRMDAVAVAIHAKLTTSDLGYLDFCYAPPFSRTWDMLNILGNVAK
jgi:NADPH-dependent 2,4-dienoyl-CoA reductase/sulfur reductase-like enzyme